MNQQLQEPSSANKPNHNQDPGPNPDPEPDRANGEGNTNSNVNKTDKLRIDGGDDLNDNHGAAIQLRSKKSVRWSEELVRESPSRAVTADFDAGSNPYVSPSPAPSSYADTFKDSVSTVKDVLGRWGKKVGEATRKAEDLSKNTWQHLKTAPSFTDAALGRIAQGAKVLADGGYDRIFRQTFETVPEEQLQGSFACYLSTSAGPVMGVMYLSTAKVAFCSDNPISYKSGDKTEWSFYKVIIPLHQLQAVNPSTSRTNSAEKYIQVISVDNHEFWYMGFLNYDGAVKCLQEALQTRDSSV